MKTKTPIIIISLFILLALVAGAYWYFFFNSDTGDELTDLNDPNPLSGFSPFDRQPIISRNPVATPAASGSPGAVPEATENIEDLPTLRLLSNTPVGGYGASTTATSTAIRWVDRGRGNVFESRQDETAIATLSNTILPRIYDSVWNKNLTAFIGSMMPEESDGPTVIFSELKKQSTSSSTAPFALKGRNISDQVLAYAASPGGDKIFLMLDENGKGAGYVANFDGSRMARIFETPLTQVNVEWPEAQTISITTKGIASGDGFLYFVNPTTGTWNKVLGPVRGLSTKTSKDAKYVLASSADDRGNIITSIHSLATGKTEDATIRTLADKCAWGNFYKSLVYCGVPAQSVFGILPDDWYRGTVSFSDKIWAVDAKTGEVGLVSSLVDQSDRILDMFNLSLDAKDEFLFFMNKNDLSLWSFDLVISN